jgi:hypothetical protein
MRKWIGIAAVALGLVAAAGCGGGDGGSALSKDEYQAEVVAAGEQVAAQFERIATEAQSISGAGIGSLDDASQAFTDLAAVVTTGEEELRGFAAKLDSLTPPDDAASANDKLVDGFTQLADDFGSLATALEGGEISEVLQLGKELEAITDSEAGTTIQSAIDELEQAGYEFETAG